MKRGFLAIPSETLTFHPHQQWAFLEADAPAPDNPSSDCSLSQRLDCNFIRGSEPQAPSCVASRLLTHTSSGIIHVCYFNQSHFGVIDYVAKHSKYNIQTWNPRNRKGERQWTFIFIEFLPILLLSQCIKPSHTQHFKWVTWGQTLLINLIIELSFFYYHLSPSPYLQL